MLELHGIDAIRAAGGRDLGSTPWFTVDQQRIDDFARATDDFEAIHVDAQAARAAGLDSTIAHGLLTLSLGPRFLYELYAVTGVPLALNYGFEKVRFLQPVPVDARVRMSARIAEVRDIEGGVRVTIEQVFEAEGLPGPVCVATAVVAYFENARVAEAASS
ncbi:MaoC family dehydratase [Kribbia dieselivorans]|uniref:MaoC family dehydratase n=1 Tax=Kribbia dieselivorans TaxID=331526 RepID=UPI000838805A|nr:MaoC family dehydratase [Kribbia dieselivorans]